MIYCPKCGGQTAIYSQRESDRGFERRRVCRECGAMLKTVERFVHFIDKHGLPYVEDKPKQEEQRE